MTYSLPQTTAELLLRAAEATHILGPEASTEDVGKFLGGSSSHAEPALAGARELGFVDQGQGAEHWTAMPLAQVLAVASPAEKAVLLRSQLQQYAPYNLFRDRLVAGESPGDAARQTCLRFEFTLDPLDAESVLINWGTYSNGLVYGEDRRLFVTVDQNLLVEALAIHEKVMAERDSVRAHIVQQLDPDAAGFITGAILERLIDSYLGILKEDPLDESMFQLGHAMEGFVKKIAQLDPPVTLPGGVRTLGQVARHLKAEGRLNSKHYGLVVAITEIRNAADHTADDEIDGASWTISRETAFAANHLTWSLMRSFFAARAGTFSL